MGGEGQIHDIPEALLHESGDGLSQGGGFQELSFLEHIFPVQDRADGRRIGAGTADPLFLHGPDQGVFRVAGGRLGKLLFFLQLQEIQAIALVEMRQRGALLLSFLRLAVVHLGKAGELQGGSAGLEYIACGDGIHGNRVIHGVGHLAGHKTPPDQPVQAVLVLRQVLPDPLRRQFHIRGTDGLMGILRFLAGLEIPGLGGIILAAVIADDVILCGGDGFGGNSEGVGTHIGDETDAALSRYVDAFIQLLGDGHGPPRGHIQAPGSLLLQRGGDEGSRRRPALILPLYTAHGKW